MLRGRACTIAPALAALALLALAASACGSEVDGTAEERATANADGAWELVEAEVDGEPVPDLGGRFLEITGDTFGAEGVCNDFGGAFGGTVQGTQEGCTGDDARDLDALEAAMTDALLAGPSADGERLVFEAGAVRLIYEPTVFATAEELFSALEDPALQADPSELFVDPEGGPLDMDRLVRRDHPDDTASYHVGTSGELVCFRWSAEDAGGEWCSRPRHAARTATAFELIGRSGSLGVRVALVPDDLSRAPELTALGALEHNVLVLDADTAPGEVVVAGDGGPEFTLVIPG